MTMRRPRSVEEFNELLDRLNTWYASFPDQDQRLLVKRHIDRQVIPRLLSDMALAEEPEAEVDPVSTRLDALLAEPDDDPVYRISEVWPAGGNVLLSAQRKAGKTTLVGNVICCLADGGFLFDTEDLFVQGFRVTGLADGETVMLVDLEMPRRTLRRWLADHKIDHSARVRAEAFRGKVRQFDILDETRRRRWAEHLIEHGTKVLIIDPLAPLLAAYGYDENDNTGVSVVLDALDTLASEAGISELLIAHHMGHTGERSRGASRLRDWPDAEWRLVREQPANPHQEPPPDAARFFIAEGRDVAVSEFKLDHDPATRKLSRAVGNRQAHASAKHSDRILTIIRDSPGASSRGIEGALSGSGVGTETIRKSLRALIDDGKVHTATGRNRTKHHIEADGCDAPTECAAALAAGTRGGHGATFADHASTEAAAEALRDDQDSAP